MSGHAVSRHLPTVAAIAGVALIAAACGGGSSNVLRSPTATLPTSSAAPSTSSTAAGQQAVTLTPATVPTAGGTVQVHATGFTPGEALVVLQCAQKGTATGSGDCNITAMAPATADANGAVSVQLHVVRGPFGANKVVCSTALPCIVSVTQATLTPTQEADTVIRFAGS